MGNRLQSSQTYGLIHLKVDWIKQQRREYIGGSYSALAKRTILFKILQSTEHLAYAILICLDIVLLFMGMFRKFLA